MSSEDRSQEPAGGPCPSASSGKPPAPTELSPGSCTGPMRGQAGLAQCRLCPTTGCPLPPLSLSVRIWKMDGQWDLPGGAELWGLSEQPAPPPGRPQPHPVARPLQCNRVISSITNSLRVLRLFFPT